MAEPKKISAEINNIIYDLNQIAGRLQTLNFQNQDTVGAGTYGDYKRRIEVMLNQLKDLHGTALILASDMNK